MLFPFFIWYQLSVCLDLLFSSKPLFLVVSDCSKDLFYIFCKLLTFVIKDRSLKHVKSYTQIFRSSKETEIIWKRTYFQMFLVVNQLHNLFIKSWNGKFSYCFILFTVNTSKLLDNKNVCQTTSISIIVSFISIL